MAMVCLTTRTTAQVLLTRINRTLMRTVLVMFVMIAMAMASQIRWMFFLLILVNLKIQMAMESAAMPT